MKPEIKLNFAILKIPELFEIYLCNTIIYFSN